MKTLWLCVSLLLAFPLVALAGGNSSLVKLHKITEIKVEDQKITIKGSGVVIRRLMSTSEKGDGSVFGQPAQWVHAKVTDAVFEVVPYFTSGIVGVPTGGHKKEELERLSKEWWAGTHEDAKQIKVGDAVTIGYQGDQTTINGFQITKMIGYGSVSIQTERTQ